jgi:hypothetical protein
MHLFRTVSVSQRCLGSTGIGLPQQLRQPREVHRHPPGFVSGQHLGLAGGLFIVAEIEPPTVCPPASERFRVLDDGPGRREAAGGHYPSLLRPSTSRKISCEASSPDSILPICSGGIDVIIWALTSRPLPEGNTGSQTPDHCSHAGLEHRRCFDDDGADRRSAGVAKGQQEVGHAVGVIVVSVAAFAQQRSWSRVGFECGLSDIAAWLRP